MGSAAEMVSGRVASVEMGEVTVSYLAAMTSSSWARACCRACSRGQTQVQGELAGRGETLESMMRCEEERRRA